MPDRHDRCARCDHQRQAHGAGGCGYSFDVDDACPCEKFIEQVSPPAMAEDDVALGEAAVEFAEALEEVQLARAALFKARQSVRDYGTVRVVAALHAYEEACQRFCAAQEGWHEESSLAKTKKED